jgi:DNA-binding MarR family transcriptional regulator
VLLSFKAIIKSVLTSGLMEMSQNESPSKLDNQLFFAFYATNLSLNKYYRKLLAPYGLTYPQYLVMLILWENDQLTVSEIGKKIFLESSTLTPLLKRLETLKLIERKRSLNDERMVLISITEKAKDLEKKVASIPEKILASVKCDPEKACTLTEDLRVIRANLSM